MTAPERATFKWGGAVFPLDAASPDTSLALAEPALAAALDFFVAVLNTYMRALWTREATAAGLPAEVIASPVAMTVPYDPAPYMREDQLKFPLLALYRVTDDIGDRTVMREHTVSRWEGVYALPPLTAAQAERMMPFLRAAAVTIARALVETADPAYEDDAQPLHAAGIEALWARSVRYGAYEATGPLSFPTAVITFEAKERQNDSEIEGAFDALDGTDVHVDGVDGSGTPEDVVVAKAP